MSPDQDAALEALQKILTSDEFRSSPRLSAFLRFCVERSLEGRADTLKAYTIATQVFMRPDHFDPQTDPIVRVEATRLRRAMQRYYSQDGAGDPLQLVMERGQYGVTFVPPSHPTVAPMQAMPQLSVNLLERLASIAEGRTAQSEPDQQAAGLAEAPIAEPQLENADVVEDPALSKKGLFANCVEILTSPFSFGMKPMLGGLLALILIFVVAWQWVPRPMISSKTDKAGTAKAGSPVRAFQRARLLVVAESASPQLGAWVDDLRDALSHFDCLVVLDANAQGDKRNSPPDFQLNIRATSKGTMMMRLVSVSSGEIIWSREVSREADQVLTSPESALWLSELAAWNGLINRRHWFTPLDDLRSDTLTCQYQAFRALLAQQLDMIQQAQSCFKGDMAASQAWSKPHWRLHLDLMALSLGDSAIDGNAVLAEAHRHIKQSPLSASAYGLAGQAYLALGRLPEARDMMAKAHVLNPYDIAFFKP